MEAKSVTYRAGGPFSAEPSMQVPTDVTELTMIPYASFSHRSAVPNTPVHLPGSAEG